MFYDKQNVCASGLLKLLQMVMLLICSQEVASLDLNWDMAYPDYAFSWFSFSPVDSTLN